MSKLSDEMPSIKKFEEDLKTMQLISIFAGKDNRKMIKDLNKEFENFVYQTEKFNDYFSDRGWIVYESMSSTIIEKAVITYEGEGIEKAEKVLIDYYLDEVNEVLSMLKYGSKELLIRFNLIEKAFEDHKAGRYYASIPLFLMIIDGAVNDYTKRQGFFAEGTEIDAWDCLVGCSDGLQKLKNIYCKGRRKTNLDPIYMPYRNGILHGRDLNYDNEHVSCKCIVLLFAIHDWMINKKNEEDRKQEFVANQNPPSWLELFKQIQKNNDDRRRISEWKPKDIVVGKDISATGKIDEYTEFPYIQKIIEMFEMWKVKNFGKLSILLEHLFKYEKSKNLRPKECRELFQNKNLIGFQILEVEDRAISLKRILVEAKWEGAGKVYTEELEFGMVFQSEDNKSLMPEDEAGVWNIIPWKIQGLYKI